MKRVPNIISSFRILGAFSLLFFDVKSAVFWIIYLLCGISDIFDGHLARRLGAESKAGAILDSVADICFVICCALKLFPIMDIPRWLWIWTGIIVLIKAINQISAQVIFKKFCFPHTTANKMTGFLLFLTVPMIFLSIIPIAIVAGIATFAAVQEGHFIRTRQIEL
ncbi:MAG: CDP-alcohol phosphatidyltransferase family protein [Bacteroidales bacterium]|nr:CDP-alcohol phosphatidyltransferase family protein [Bacteroidales bacterium]